MILIVIIFFKQKPAYELRISDWSSDVCSSDLFADVAGRLAAAHLVIGRAGASTVAELAAAGRPAVLVPYPSATDDHQTGNAQALVEAGGGWLMPQASLDAAGLAERLASLLDNPRSEEQTSELPSLNRISYAVFCLKKKKQLLRSPH